MRVLPAMLLLACAASAAPALDVRISAELEYLDVTHQGRNVRIQRNQDPEARISDRYARTSRKCPPFCVQPAVIAAGVETIGELELLDYLRRMSAGDSNILVIDSRTPDWVREGTIPGSINIPWTMLNTDAGADPFQVADLMQQQFGVRGSEGLWDFSGAKTLVLFCNGIWCGQSPNNIRTLLRYGYPAERLKWYRGGMQDWEALGLTVVR